MAFFPEETTKPSPSRTRKILFQSGIGLVSKIGAIGATLAATPLMLKLLGGQQLGVWLVLLSVFQWITMFDLGIAAGARNEIARAFAVRDELRVRQAITTGWFYVAAISLFLFIGGAGILTLTSLSDWLRQRVFSGVDVTITLWLILGGACITFALNFVQSAYAAMEKASAFSLFSLVVNVGFLLLLVLANIWSIDSMELIAIMYTVAMLCGNAWLILQFFRSYPQFIPDRYSINNALSGVILKFGVRLFIVQLAALIIFTTSRLLASAWLGPESVVVYDAGFKVFAIVTMLHTLIMSTIWSSFTQAFERGEFLWIRQTIRRLALLMIPLIVACVVLAVIAPTIVRHWLGSAQVGSISLYLMLAITTILSCWSNIYAYLLNGVGDTRIQMISAIFAGVINIPASYFFTVTLGMGLTGIVLGTLVSLLPFSILGPSAVRKLLREHV
jgi:O-antigen/teichoic acid export membrane protein